MHRFARRWPLRLSVADGQIGAVAGGAPDHRAAPTYLGYTIGNTAGVFHDSHHAMKSGFAGNVLATVEGVLNDLPVRSPLNPLGAISRSSDDAGLGGTVE